MCVNEDGDARMVFSIEQSVDRYSIVPCRKNCTHLWGKKNSAKGFGIWIIFKLFLHHMPACTKKLKHIPWEIRDKKILHKHFFTNVNKQFSDIFQKNIYKMYYYDTKSDKETLQKYIRQLFRSIFYTKEYIHLKSDYHS